MSDDPIRRFTHLVLLQAWQDNATTEQYYRIERSTDGVTFTEVGIVIANATSWTNWWVPAGTYHYRVRASTGTIYSSYSNVAQITVGP